MYNKVWVPLIASAAIAGCAQLSPPTPSSPPPPPVVIEQPVIPESFPHLLFATGTVDLSVDNRLQIRKIAEVLKQPTVREFPVQVIGHTDDRGAKTANEKVGLERADATARELVFNGVSSERITVGSRGESEPAAPNSLADGSDNPEGRALNRRVEITLVR